MRKRTLRIFCFFMQIPQSSARKKEKFLFLPRPSVADVCVAIYETAEHFVQVRFLPRSPANLSGGMRIL